jgi:hypothetical protein
MDPIVFLPMDSGANRAATPTADPAEKLAATLYLANNKSCQSLWDF